MTPEAAQKLVALARADEVKGSIAAFRAELHAADRDARPDAVRKLIDLIGGGTVDPVLARGRVDPLLRSLQGLGTVKANRMLRAAGIFNPNLRVEALTPRQRQALVRQLDTWRRLDRWSGR